jgi:hypothetical protein
MAAKWPGAWWRVRGRPAGTILFTGATASVRGSAHLRRLPVPSMRCAHWRRAWRASSGRAASTWPMHHRRRDRHRVHPRQLSRALRAEGPRRHPEPRPHRRPYWMLHQQPRDAWTELELDLRPALSSFPDGKILSLSKGLEASRLSERSRVPRNPTCHKGLTDEDPLISGSTSAARPPTWPGRSSPSSKPPTPARRWSAPDAARWRVPVHRQPAGHHGAAKGSYLFNDFAVCAALWCAAGS